MAYPKPPGDSASQEEIAKAHRKAYDAGMADGRAKASSSPSNYTTNLRSDKDTDIAATLTMMQNMPFGLGKIAGALSSAVNIAREKLNVPSLAREFIRPLEIESQVMLFNQFKEQLGDLQRLGKVSANETVESFRLSRENIASDYSATVSELEATKPELVLDVLMGDGSRQQMNLLQAGFKDVGAVQNQYFENLMQNQETYGNILSRQLVGQETQIARYTKGFNFSTDQTATFLKRQLDLTGESSTAMLDDLQKFSISVADATGVSFKTIGKVTEKIVGDVENFGNVTTEEATRIAGALTSAGISFEKFSGMVGNFQNFDSAAGAVSNLTAVFGVQLDTMDLMMKANEDQEGFLHTLRDSFLDQGLAVDDLNLSQKKLLASQLQMGVSDVERFFREGLMPDQEALEEATDTADTEVAIKRINDGLLTLMNTGASVEEVLAKGLRESLLLPIQQQVIDLGNNLSSTALNFRGSIMEANQILAGLPVSAQSITQDLYTLSTGDQKEFVKFLEESMGLEDVTKKGKETTMKTLGAIVEKSLTEGVLGDPSSPEAIDAKNRMMKSFAKMLDAKVPTDAEITAFKTQTDSLKGNFLAFASDFSSDPASAISTLLTKTTNALGDKTADILGKLNAGVTKLNKKVENMGNVKIDIKPAPVMLYLDKKQVAAAQQEYELFTENKKE